LAWAGEAVRDARHRAGCENENQGDSGDQQDDEGSSNHEKGAGSAGHTTPCESLILLVLMRGCYSTHVMKSLLILEPVSQAQ
jgi:hypothetical protein